MVMVWVQHIVILILIDMNVKARIINSEDFGDIYTNDFIIERWDTVVNGQLVSEWELTLILPNPEWKIPKWNGSEWVEGATQEEIQALNLQKAMQIDLEYKDRITKLLNIPVQKMICEELDSIPLDILEEKERLKTECNEKIIALGITDFSFRKKVTINLKE